MFEDLRRAFREAVANFRHELHRDEVPAEADRLLGRMQAELERRSAANRRLRDEIRDVLEEAEREEEERATCRRREGLARGAEDAETARIAGEFARRHRERRDVLHRKALALRDELRIREDETQELQRRMAEARTRREDLTARASRTSAGETLRETDRLFEDLDRMAERVSEMENRASAAEEPSDLGEELDADRA